MSQVLGSAGPVAQGAGGRRDPRTAAPETTRCRPPQAIFEWCPLCAEALLPEHAHYRCPSCGWRDSCCD